MNQNPKKWWLRIFITLVLIMISVGGVTRLTRSGLSIVEWKPVAGIIPPLNEEEWQAQFALYQQSPEFLQVNSQFEIGDYKRIFIWEYLHRVLGRIVFFVALIPGIVLWRKKLVSGQLVFLLSSLVAFQGLIGWLMVKSGLNKMPHVSPFMLALHFFSALTVLLVAHYHLSKIRTPLKSPLNSTQKRGFFVVGGVLLFQVFYGCLTSGWKAGYAFGTYPLMGGEFFPPGGMIQEPWWSNFVMNPSTVQWVHRWNAILLLVSTAWLLRSFVRTPAWSEYRRPLVHLLGVMFSQILLGISVLLFVVPISLAVLHQLIAAMMVVTFAGIVFRIQEE